MDKEEKEEVFKAMNRALDVFHEALEGWNIIPPVRIEVRELRDDFSLGEMIVVDEIKEYLREKEKPNK